MKVGLYSPYLSTMGGGERYFFTVAQFFLERKDKVDIFSLEPKIDAIKERFGLDLQGVNFLDNPFKGNIVDRFWKTKDYDVIFFLSDGSIPISFSKKTILHFQTPFHGRFDSFLNRLKLKMITKVVCNSNFTKEFIDHSYVVNSSVLYPPVDVTMFKSSEKENLILSVGRFFSPSHPKKQNEMITAFLQLIKDGKLKNWKLVLLGGITNSSASDIDELKKKTQGFPIEIITDVSFPVLQEKYSKAKIYWHAAGFDEDLNNYPMKAEHFGITTVEAMSAGCVPVVFRGGGQMEIVRDNVDGFLWNTIDELKKNTLELISNSDLTKKMSISAINRSSQFSKQIFFSNLGKIIS